MMEERIGIPQVVRLDCWVGDESWDIVDLTDSRRVHPEEKALAVHSTSSQQKSITLYRVKGKKKEIVQQAIGNIQGVGWYNGGWRGGSLAGTGEEESGRIEKLGGK